MGYADMLLRQIGDDSRLSKVSRCIMSETERMADIVRKIGKLTKYETKTYVGDTKIIDIERSIDSEPQRDNPERLGNSNDR
jgi:signal transduction histidine kinase